MRRAWLASVLALGAAALIVVTFSYPLWVLTARAVQYEQDFPDGLKVRVYLTTVQGDLYEFEIMNKWIGAHFPARVPEHRVFPVLFGTLAVLCAAAACPTRWRERALRLVLVLFVAAGLAGAASLQWRLYAFGHDRDPNPFATVPDFTVPILGSARLYNWSITTGFATGAYTMALAALLVALAWGVVRLDSGGASAPGARAA